MHILRKLHFIFLVAYCINSTTSFSSLTNLRVSIDMRGIDSINIIISDFTNWSKVFDAYTFCWYRIISRDFQNENLDIFIIVYISSTGKSKINTHFKVQIYNYCHLIDQHESQVARGLLDNFNNYLRLRSTTTPTGKLHGAISKCIYNMFFKVYAYFINSTTSFSSLIKLRVSIDIRGIDLINIIISDFTNWSKVFDAYTFCWYRICFSVISLLCYIAI
jgi:hypothetical protein